GCRAATCRRRWVRAPAPARPSPGRHGTAPPRARRPACRRSLLAADGLLAQGPAVLLEGHELAEHPVVLRRVLDRVGPLELGLEVGDPAHGGHLLQAVDV